jgi:outer membrane protein TolC
MLKQKIMVSFFIASLIISNSFAQQKAKELTLEECILQAVKNNLGLAVEVLNPEIADLTLSRAKEKFLPSLSFNYAQQETNSASYSWIDSATQAPVKTFYNDYSAGVSQFIPTGGSFSISLETYISNTNRSLLLINPVYSSTLGFSFVQPLLKDFGFRASRKEIRVADNNREISRNDLKSALLNTIYNVEEAYWNLVYSIESLKVKKQSLDLARDTLSKTKKEVEIGTMAPKEILSAQAEVASRQADILQAEAMVKNYVDLLKTLINLPEEEGIEDIIPVDQPGFEKREISLDEAFRTAAENRPDLKKLKINLKNKEIERGYAKNQLLPSLDFTANYWSPGLSGDQILYEGGNALTGNVIGKIPGKISESLKDALNFKYKNWSFYFTLEIPFNTFLSRADYARAKVEVEQAELRIKQQEQQAFLEIKTAVRAVGTDYQRVQAYKIARELAEQKLEAEESKLRAGLSSNYFVLQYQRDLALAKSSELKAVIDYNLSLSRLDKALGITLEKKNIKL